MKKLRTIIISLVAILGVGATVLPVAPAFAAPVDSIQEGVNGVGGDDDQSSLEEGIKTIVNVLLFILGAIAVIMIIIGGIRYTTSNGDANATKGAKDTILYAVIGLIVAILAYAIVNFVLDAFTGN
jgi:hypothetical protein